MLLIWAKTVVVVVDVVVQAGCQKRFAFAASAAEAPVIIVFEDSFEKAEKVFFENQNGVRGKIDGAVAAGPWVLAHRVH